MVQVIMTEQESDFFLLQGELLLLMTQVRGITIAVADLALSTKDPDDMRRAFAEYKEADQKFSALIDKAMDRYMRATSGK